MRSPPMRCKRPIEAAGTQLAADKKCTTGIVGAKPRLSWAANGAALLRSLSLSLSLRGREVEPAPVPDRPQPAGPRGPSGQYRTAAAAAGEKSNASRPRALKAEGGGERMTSIGEPGNDNENVLHRQPLPAERAKRRHNAKLRL